jgi:hypothetical protein
MHLKKENIKVIQFFQDKIKNNKSISIKDLDNLQIDNNIINQKYRNIILKKDFFGDWVIEIINPDLDLDGNSISDNKKLISRLKALWENNIKAIKFSELIEMNILPSKASLLILNFKLTNNSFLVSNEYYDISIVDKSKSIDGLFLDNAINTDSILDVLKHFTISAQELAKISELQLNKILEEHFKNYFQNVKKGGASDKGLIDLIIGDLVYGIELKLARELKDTAESDRAKGQIDRYMDKFGNNFMVIIAGSDTEKKEKTIQDLIKKIKKNKGAIYYLETN